MRTKPRWKIGDPVVLWQDSRNPRCSKEYGVVVGMLWDNVQKWWNVRVLFFGHKWPSYTAFKDHDEYYTLRYLETSLKPYKPKDRSHERLRRRLRTLGRARR